MKNSISRRWLRIGLFTVSVIVVLISVSVAFVARNYYYNGIQQIIKEQMNNFMLYLDNSVYSNSSFSNIARNYVDNFQYKGKMGVVVFDDDDNIVISTTGLNSGYDDFIYGYDEAKNSLNGNFVWVGRQSTNEKVIAITNIVYSSNGEKLGALYYVVSLEKADFQIILLTFFSILLAISVATPAMLMNARFLKTLTLMLDEVSETTKKIALGKFETRIDKVYNDEIGTLCDAINHMANELGQSEKLKNDFISSVSHELRTPLTAIKGWSETIRYIEPSEVKTMNKGLKIITKETERLSSIVEELLDFSRMQSKRMNLVFEKVDMLAELDEIVYLYRERALSENKHLVFESDTTIKPVLADRNRIRQVFVNLIDNSLKYTSKDDIITASVVCDDKNVYVIISDTGCGIPKESLPKVTEKFYKVNNTKRGSGIGLAVVNEIINLHSGVLKIESEENIGTTVTVSIPCIKETT